MMNPEPRPKVGRCSCCGGPKRLKNSRNSSGICGWSCSPVSLVVTFTTAGLTAFTISTQFGAVTVGAGSDGFRSVQR